MKKIDEEDLSAVMSIAKKYNMTVNSFCNLVLESNVGTTRQIRFSENEYKLINNIADSLSLTFNAFINVCLRNYLENKETSSLNKQDMLLHLDRKKKDKRVNIDFNNIIFAQKINSLAIYYGMPLPSLVRYIVFKYINENYDFDDNGILKVKTLSNI